MSSFSATVDDWVLKTKEDIEAVFKTGLQYTVDEILDRTPIDTGFMKSSLQGSTTGFLPLTGKQTQLITPAAPVELVIAGLDISQTFYANYTANYAIYVENGARGRAGRGMVKLAAQNWQQNINRAVALLK